MKIKSIQTFLEKGTKEDIDMFERAKAEIIEAIKLVVWPENAKSFLIRPTLRGNGVVPIKKEFIAYLKSREWHIERRFELVAGIGAGPIDAVWETDLGMIAVEWETGNISSSHRAINKMATAIIENRIIAGFLVIPVRNFAKYLTDRIGNFEEIEPYFVMWRNLNISRGMLAIVAIEHDGESTKIPYIPKGKDGNAKRASRNYPKSGLM